MQSESKLPTDAQVTEAEPASPEEPGPGTGLKETAPGVQTEGLEGSTDNIDSAADDSRRREEDSPSPTRPGISPKTLVNAGVRHVSGAEALQLCGLEASGLWIPFHTADGAPVTVEDKPFGRLRLDEPRGDFKYYQAPGTGVRVYFPPGLRALPRSGRALTLVEGEFKALALVEAGIPAVGICGYFGFHPGGQPHQPVDALAELIASWNPAEILFLGDTDTALNAQFAVAACRFRDLVEPLAVRLPRLPLDGPKGVDDLREAAGAGFAAHWQTLCGEAVPLTAGISPGRLALTLLEREKKHLASATGSRKDEYIEKLASMGAWLQAGFPLIEDELVAFVKGVFGVKVRAFRQAVRKAATDSGAGHQAASTGTDADAELAAIEQLVSLDEGTPYYVTSTGTLRINQQYWVKQFAAVRHVLFDPLEATFYLYDSEKGLWERRTEAAVAQLFSEDIKAYADRTGEQRLVPLRTNLLLTGLVNLLRGAVEKTGAFSAAPGLIHLADGMLDLNVDPPGRRDFHPDFFSRSRVPFALDVDAECPRFLGELLGPALSADDLSLVQRWVGSVLLGGNPAQRLIVFTGTTNGGKSTLVTVIENMIGLDNVVELRTHFLNERFELFRFVGRRLLTAKDVDSNFLERPPAQVIKRLVGHDRLTAEAKNSNQPFPLVGNFAVAITSNSSVLRVHLERDIDAWKRRLLLVPFNRKPPARRIPDLAEQLVATEGPGILRWMVAGAVLHQQELRECGDFVLTREQRARITRLLAESDSIREFCRARLKPCPTADVTSVELVQAYDRFCGEQAWVPIPAKHARQRLVETIDELLHVRPSHDISRGGGSHRGFRGLQVVEPERSTAGGGSS